jgi:hypothetical protein
VAAVIDCIVYPVEIDVARRHHRRRSVKVDRTARHHSDEQGEP